MIFPSQRLVYIKIPKTGSTSVYRHFIALDKYSTIINLNKLHGIKRDPRCYRKSAGWFLGAHVSAQDIQWYLGTDYDEHFKFTVVRNPYDRLVSNFCWQRSKGRGPATFKAFVNTLVKDPKSLPKQSRLHAIPQTDWITDEDGRVIVDRIVRFENLESEIRAVLDELHLPAAKLRHRNKTDRAHYSNYYDDEVRRMVEVFYQQDLEQLGYRFENRPTPGFVENDLHGDKSPSIILKRLRNRLRRLL